MVLSVFRKAEFIDPHHIKLNKNTKPMSNKPRQNKNGWILEYHHNNLLNPLRKSLYKERDYGSNPLNEYKNGYESHHLHLENNSSFSIYFPKWLHKLWKHNSVSKLNLDTINAIALDYWINEDIYGWYAK